MSIVKANSWASTNNVPYDKLIQHKSYSIAGQVIVLNNPGAAYTSTSLSITLTSVRANSRFYVMADCQGYIDSNATNGWNIALVRTINTSQVFVAGTQSNDSWMGMYHGSGFGANSWSRCRTALDSPAVPKGTSITYNVWVGGWTTNGGNFYLGYNGYGDMGNRITVFEIAS